MLRRIYTNLIQWGRFLLCFVYLEYNWDSSASHYLLQVTNTKSSAVGLQLKMETEHKFAQFVLLQE